MGGEPTDYGGGRCLLIFVWVLPFLFQHSDVLLACAPPLGGKEERTDDISDYGHRASRNLHRVYNFIRHSFL